MSPDLMPLADILLAIKRALEFIDGYDVRRFRTDLRTRYAVYSQIIIVGEAARRISRGFQEQHPNLPWAEMTGMRHKLVHDYDDIDWELVWDTVTSDFPGLRAAVEPLVPDEPKA